MGEVVNSGRQGQICVGTNRSYQRKQQRERLSGHAKAQTERGRNPVDYC